MNLEDYPGINKQRKDKIFAMSDAELLLEIEKGRESIMPGCIPFMKVVLDERKNAKASVEKTAEQAYNDAVLLEAKLANALSKQAIDESKSANRFSIWAIVISLVAIAISIALGG